MGGVGRERGGGGGGGTDRLKSCVVKDLSYQ